MFCVMERICGHDLETQDDVSGPMTGSSKVTERGYGDLQVCH